MYSKLSKYYKNDNPDASGFTLEEIEQIAEEIRVMLVGPRGLTLPEYVKAAEQVMLSTLGHRLVFSIKNEPKLEVYFPTEIWKILKERCDKVTKVFYTKRDKEFIENNSGKGYKWIAEKMFVNPKNLTRRTRWAGINVRKKVYDYTPEVSNFIKNNLDKGAKWIGDKLGMDQKAIRSKCVREGWPITQKPFKRYTKEEDDFIIKNADKGSVWLAKELGRSREGIKDRAGIIGAKITTFMNSKIVRPFSDNDDAFLRKNSDKGYVWISKALNRSIESVFNRARYKNITIGDKYHVYTRQEDEFIINNLDKGLDYIASALNVTIVALKKHAKRVGINVKGAK